METLSDIIKEKKKEQKRRMRKVRLRKNVMGGGLNTSLGLGRLKKDSEKGRSPDEKHLS